MRHHGRIMAHEHLEEDAQQPRMQQQQRFIQVTSSPQFHRARKLLRVYIHIIYKIATHSDDDDEDGDDDEDDDEDGDDDDVDDDELL